MSINYGGPPAGGAAYGGGGYGPPRRASVDWINEAWRLFSEQAGTWIVSCIAAILLPLVLYFIFIFFVFGISTVLALQPGQGHNGGLGTGASVGLIIFIVLFWIGYGLLYMPFIYSGVYRMAVRQVRGELIGIGDIFAGGAKTLRMLGYHMVYSLITFILTLVLSIPLSLLHLVSFAAISQHNPNYGAMPDVAGLLIWYAVLLVCFSVMAILLFPVHALIADGEGVFSAIGRSVAAMKTQILPTAGILFLFGLLFIVGAIPCFLGWFVVFPMFWLVSALAYRDIIGIPGRPDGTVLMMPGGYGTPQAGVWPPPPDARPPAFGQPPATDPLPPPRRSLSGDEMDENTPPPSAPPL